MLLYIHIPFCDSKCFYCAFNSYVDKFHLKHSYMKALYKQLEIEVMTHVKNKNKTIKSLFIGGGTPSAIKHEAYEKIFEIIKPFINEETEITTEANPNSATRQWLEGMYNMGVNRVSFGVQSFDDNKLKVLGRSHKSNRAIKSIQDASCIGFKAINCDIIYGVQGDDFISLKKDFDLIATLPITHLSAYSLTIEKETKFFNQKNIKMDDEILSQEIFSYLEGIGFKQYEISNFAKDKKYQSRHNIGYWEHKEYLGIGCGAVGYVNSSRYYPHKELEKYIKDPLFADIEKLSNKDIKVEKVLLGFRTSIGVSLDLFTKREKAKVNELTIEKKLDIIDNRLVNNNFLLADELALYILD